MVAALTDEHLCTQPLSSEEEAGKLTPGSNVSRAASKEFLETAPWKPFGKSTKHSKWTVTFPGNVTTVQPDMTSGITFTPILKLATVIHRHLTTIQLQLTLLQTETEPGVVLRVKTQRKKSLTLPEQWASE